MIRKLFLLMMNGLMKGLMPLLLLAAPVLGVAATQAELRGIGLVSADGGARVALDTSRVTTSSLFTLQNPYRVVIDLRNTRLAAGVRAPKGLGLIDQVRTGPRPGGTLRIVIELRSSTPARGQWRAGSSGGSFG